MSYETDLIEKLTSLNRIADTLNQAVDVRGVLNDALADLVGLMGLETGWIFLQDVTAEGGYTLAAHHNLPPALATANPASWQAPCTCKQLCDQASFDGAYNEVHCPRLQNDHGERRGLAMHASTPLQAGDRILGVLNVAAPDWASFDAAALTLLTNVGGQIGVALERAQLYDMLQAQRVREQAVLLRLSSQLLGRLGLGDVMDYLVEEVQRILDADACALLLPNSEGDSLEFLATVGWKQNPTLAKRRAPAHGHSGPGWAMRAQQSLQAEDLEAHDPTAWRPAWIRTEGFRAHAVEPLIVDGRSIGALVVNYRHPRRLNDDELRLLHLMANQAAMAIDKIRLHREMVKAETMAKEMAVGRDIQLSLLPEAPKDVPGWEFSAFYEAAQQVGGDFYDFFELPAENSGKDGSSRLGLVIADVAGKGVPAALFMARSSTMLRVTGQKNRSPATTLAEVDERIFKDQRCDLFLTGFYAILDTASGQLQYANGGHNRPLWLQSDSGAIQELAARGIVLGAWTGCDFEEREITVAPGDYLVFYTDGVTEAMNADSQFFGTERLEAAVARSAGGSAREMVDAIVAAVRDFAGDVTQADDLTLFVARRERSVQINAIRDPLIRKAHSAAAT